MDNSKLWIQYDDKHKDRVYWRIELLQLFVGCEDFMDYIPLDDMEAEK